MGAPSCLAKTLRLCPQPRAPCSWEQPSTGLPDAAVQTARRTNAESISPINPLASRWRAAGPDSSSPTKSIQVRTQSQPVPWAPPARTICRRGPSSFHPPFTPRLRRPLCSPQWPPTPTEHTPHLPYHPPEQPVLQPRPPTPWAPAQPAGPRTRVTRARRAGGRAAQGRSRLKGARAAIRAQNPRARWEEHLSFPVPSPRGAMRSTACPVRPRAGSAPYLRDVVHALLESVQDDLLQHRHGLLAGRQRAGEQGLLGACGRQRDAVTPACAHPSPHLGFGGAIAKAPQPGRHSLPGLQG